MRALDHGPGPAPATVDWTARAGAWIAIGASPGGLMVGAALGSRYGLVVAVVAAAAGSALLGGFAFLQAAVAQHRGERLAMLLARLMTQPVAHTLTELLLAASMVGWLAFYVSIQAEALGGGPVRVVAVAAALGLLAVGGLKRWNLLVWVASLGSVALAGALLVTLRDVEAGPPELWLGLPVAVASALGFGAVFVVRCAYFSYDLRERTDVRSAAIAFIASLLVFESLGAVLGARHGEWDLVALSRSGSAAGLGRAILLVSSCGAALTSLHSGGLALQHAARVPGRAAVMVIASSAAALAMFRFDLALRGWLGWLGIVALPLAVVMVAAERRSRSLDCVDGLVLAVAMSGSVVARAAGIDWYVFVGVSVAMIAMLARSAPASRCSRP